MFINKSPNGLNNISGKKIATYRKQRKLSQRALADNLQILGLDIDKNAIQRIEAGKRFVTDIELKIIASFFRYLWMIYWNKTRFVNKIIGCYNCIANKRISNLREGWTTMDDYAILTNDGVYTIFEYKTEKIKFMTSKRLERYTKILEWDHGYLVVMAKYYGLTEVEEYIDLVPILDNLYYDVDEFLTPIKEVKIEDVA